MVEIPKEDLSQPELRQGNLEVRLARNAGEIEALQALRYRVFYGEMAAKPTREMATAGRDFDDYDQYCDHLVVIDHNRGAGANSIVGTYRLLRREHAAKAGRFYTSDEYDISRLVEYPGEIMELGRSCVDAAYRTRPSMQLLWRGIAAYVFRYDIALMFGCASMRGIDTAALAHDLAYLHYYHLAPANLRPVAVPERFVDMRLLPQEDVQPRRALASLPPLIKGYLRLGGFVGDGAVVDYQFNTTDVCVVVKTDQVTDKYYRHYERKHRDASQLNGGTEED